MPRFQQLSHTEINEKSPGDLVTIADLESEKRLEDELTSLLPDSICIGEEAAESDPSILDRITGEAPVWVIDPLDGTRNFAHGRAPFAVIVALVVGGTTQMGWIHDPVTDETIWAGRGQGAWSAGQQLQLGKTKTIAAMKGSLSLRIARRLDGKPGVPEQINRVGCVGRDYMDLTSGKLDFARYAFRLKPWDHAAGVLLYDEAGGYSRLIRANQQYQATLQTSAAEKANEVLILAPDRESCRQLVEMLEDT